MSFLQDNDVVVNLVVGQLQGEPLPIQQALESCSRTIATLEHRIATAQRLLADQAAIRDLLTAAAAKQPPLQT